MIQLANDPQASRTEWRAAQGGAPKAAPVMARGRSGHAWPFLSRYAARPVSQDTQKPAANDSDSGS